MFWRRRNTNGKKIVFFGRGYKDYLIYMAYTLNNMGYSVLIHDRSKEKELADIISHHDFSTEMRTYRNVDFNFSRDNLTGYQYVFYYYSEYSKELDWEKRQFTILNASVFKSDLQVCQNIMNHTDSDVILIIRDRIRNSIDKKYIAKYIIKPSKLLGMHEIRFDEYDKEYQFRMDYDGVGSFKYLSDNYVNVLVKTICAITGKGQGRVRKALKYAKEGKIFDNRFLE